MLALGSCHVWMHHSWMPCHSRGERLLSSEIYGNRKTFFPSGKHGKVSERMIFKTVLQGHQSDQSQFSCATPSNTAIISYHPTLFMLCSCWNLLEDSPLAAHAVTFARSCRGALRRLSPFPGPSGCIMLHHAALASHVIVLLSPWLQMLQMLHAVLR